MEILFKFDTLNEVMDYYGKDNLIPIDYIKQQIFYAKKGIQPKFIYENENEKGRLTCWYLKSETRVVYDEWLEYKKANKTGNKSLC